MATELWTGTPGSGKSLHVAKDIRENLRYGKKVISTCNIDTDLCFMNKLQEFLFNISRVKFGYILMINEPKTFTMSPTNT